MSAILENVQSKSQADDLVARVSAETKIRADEPLAKRTTLRVGGAADIYVEPATETDLVNVLRFCAESEIKFFVLGRGSNLIVRDGGFRGVVIHLAQPEFSKIEISGEQMRCGAGAKLKSVAVEAKRNGIAKLEFLEGIPGTVGGALRMNAGAMTSATFEVVESVRLMDFDGNIREIKANEMAVEYRCCPTLKTHIALGAIFRGAADSAEFIGQRMMTYSRKRWASQPATPSAGCMFKNPSLQIPAGKLIDELGLKGTRVGGAFVSAEHGNFLVNDGSATAHDVLQLIELVRQRVKEARGIELHTEVEVIGDEK
jgi:UDP-N-acetylenolpyruvoylglucosamine reductase